MTRGSDAAVLFGNLVHVIRKAGTGSSMQPIGEKVGGAAAIVSQVENAQRGLKAGKVPIWAKALEVDEGDFHELWLLCQGLVPVGDDAIAYTSPDATLSDQLSDPIALEAIKKYPDLEPIYRLTARIMTLMEQLVPTVHAQWARFEPDINELGEWATPEFETRDYERAWLPIFDLYWPGSEQSPRPPEIHVPLLDPARSGDLRRSPSVPTDDLYKLISGLSAPERDRVRGYIDAVIERRSTN